MEFDLVTIGAGSGGVRASRFASANYGASVRPPGVALLSSAVACSLCHSPNYALKQRLSCRVQVACIELPFGFVASETVGGAGGT
jgi:glutathione reductase (NADPH)